MISLTKTKKILLVLTIVVSVLFPVKEVVAATTDDPYVIPSSINSYFNKKSVVSQSLIDPSKLENGAPYTDGLDSVIVPGIPEYYQSVLPVDDVTAINQRIEQDKEKITKIQSTISGLKEFRAKADEIASQWRVLNAFNSEALGTGPNSINYNRWRRQIIDQMLVDANQKLSLMQYDLDTRASRLDQLNLEKAEASGDSTQITQARNQAGQSLKNRKNSRVAVQTELAKEKALEEAACWPAGSLKPNLYNCALEGTATVGNLLTWIFALLLWVAGKLLDLSIYISISQIGYWFQLGAVATVWRVCRDLANLCFVFILLYIALGTVFDLKGISSPQRMITSVVIVALLVNFSGFMVRVVVDTSNIIAYEFYSQINNTETGGISTRIIQKMDLARYFIDANSINEALGKADANFTPPRISRLNFASVIGQTLGNIIVILITAFIFLAAAILFITRTVTLLLVYIFSPIAIVSRIIPSNKFNYFDDWLDKLIKQSFFAPAFLIPLYIVFVLLNSGGIVDLVGNSSGLAQSLSLVMIDAIIIGLLFGCLNIANKFGISGAKMVSGWGKTLGLGSLGVAGAYTVGRGMYKLGQNQKVQDWAASSRVGMGARRAFNYLGNYNFKTGTSGYQSRVEARQKTQQQRGGSFVGPNASAQRATYLSRLYRAGDRDAYYRGLSAEDKATVEQKLRSQGRGGEADRLLSILGGGGARTAAATAWRGVDQTDRMRHLEAIGDQDQLNNLYEGLNARERAELEDLARGTSQEARIATAKTAYSSSPRATVAQRAETAREAGRVERMRLIGDDLDLDNPTRGHFANPLDAFNPTWTTAHPDEMRQINNLRSMGRAEFVEFANNHPNLFDGSYQDIYPYLTSEQLRAILDPQGIGLGEVKRTAVRKEIIKHRGTTTHPDPIFERAYQYLTNPTQGGQTF